MADKKLLEESVIARFQQLANIPKTSKGMLSEGTMKGTNAGRSTVVPREEGFAGGHTAIVSEEEEMDAPEGDDAGMDPMAGDDMGADAEGGGDDAIKQAFDSAIEAFNQLANAVPALKNSKVELDTGDEGEDMEAPEGDMAEPVMESEDGNPDDLAMEETVELEEELDESIELVDDTLIEKLLQRVSARLVAEARKNRELAEGKKGWGPSGMSKGKPPKHKGSPKGKVGTPFTKSVSVKGLAGRGK